MCATNIQEKKITLIELTIPWDSSYEQAKTRKEERYTPLIAELAELGWQANLITLEIGSRGYTANSTASELARILKKKTIRGKALTNANQTAISSSYIIYQQRNNGDWTENTESTIDN